MEEFMLRRKRVFGYGRHRLWAYLIKPKIAGVRGPHPPYPFSHNPGAAIVRAPYAYLIRVRNWLLQGPGPKYVYEVVPA